jgi:hypothetical protein
MSINRTTRKDFTKDGIPFWTGFRREEFGHQVKSRFTEGEAVFLRKPVYFSAASQKRRAAKRASKPTITVKTEPEDHSSFRSRSPFSPAKSLSLSSSSSSSSRSSRSDCDSDDESDANVIRLLRAKILSMEAAAIEIDDDDAPIVRRSAFDEDDGLSNVFYKEDGSAETPEQHAERRSAYRKLSSAFVGRFFTLYVAPNRELDVYTLWRSIARPLRCIGRVELLKLKTDFLTMKFAHHRTDFQNFISNFQAQAADLISKGAKISEQDMLTVLEGAVEHSKLPLRTKLNEMTALAAATQVDYTLDDLIDGLTTAAIHDHFYESRSLVAPVGTNRNAGDASRVNASYVADPTNPNRPSRPGPTAERLKEMKKTVCKSFLLGKCKWGKDCRFSHQLNLKKPPLAGAGAPRHDKRRNGNGGRKNTTPPNTAPPRDISKVECFGCHAFGHYRNNCPSASSNANTSVSAPVSGVSSSSKLITTYMLTSVASTDEVLSDNIMESKDRLEPFDVTQAYLHLDDHEFGSSRAVYDSDSDTPDGLPALVPLYDSPDLVRGTPSVSDDELPDLMPYESSVEDDSHDSSDSEAEEVDIRQPTRAVVVKGRVCIQGQSQPSLCFASSTFAPQLSFSPRNYASVDREQYSAAISAEIERFPDTGLKCSRFVHPMPNSTSAPQLRLIREPGQLLDAAQRYSDFKSSRFVPARLVPDKPKAEPEKVYPSHIFAWDFFARHPYVDNVDQHYFGRYSWKQRRRRLEKGRFKNCDSKSKRSPAVDQSDPDEDPDSDDSDDSDPSPGPDPDARPPDPRYSPDQDSDFVLMACSNKDGVDNNASGDGPNDSSQLIPFKGVVDSGASHHNLIPGTPAIALRNQQVKRRIVGALSGSSTVSSSCGDCRLLACTDS